MNILDYLIIAVLGGSALLGLLRGFTREVFSLFAWIVAFIAARSLTPALADWLPVGEPGSLLRPVLTFVALMVVARMVLDIFSRLVAALLRGIGLGPLDRLLGLIFGTIRGGAFVLLLVWFAGLTDFPRQLVWQKSLLMGPFETLAQHTTTWLPAVLAQQINFSDYFFVIPERPAWMPAPSVSPNPRPSPATN